MTVVRITPAGQVLGTTYTLAPGAAATGVIDTTYTLAPGAAATDVIETRCDCGGHLFHHDGCRGVAEQRQIDAEREHFASKDAAHVVPQARQVMTTVRFKQRYGSYEHYVMLWPESVDDIARVERAYWASFLRAKRTWAAMNATMRAIYDAGGVAYAKCRGNCEQPCFYRYIAEARPNDFVTAYLDDHAKQLGSGMRAWRGDMLPEREPIHLDLGEAQWAAERAVGTANSKWLAWRDALGLLLTERLTKRCPPVDKRTAHVYINNRDYWLASRQGRYGWNWEVLLMPEGERVQVTAGDLDAAR